ncbi:MAG: substrate-binding domain-containing protein [Bacteroidetes bacterium]|nr:substrate-binding domain-containing protein [Bacteroidota bacterium]
MLGFSLLILVVSGCGKKEALQPQSDTATSGSFELVADETLRPVIDSLVRGFNQQTPNATVSVRYTSAALALDALIQNKARLVLIGRPLTVRERHLFDSIRLDLPEFDVALNGIAAIVSNSNSMRSLSLDSLRSLVEGKWDMRYYSTSYLGSTESALDSIFSLQPKTLTGRIRRFETTDSVIDAVRRDPLSIGFIGSSWLHQLDTRHDSTIRALRISSSKSPEPLQLHLAYMYQGLYPLVSRVCGYTFEQPNTIPRGFLAYAMSADGQRVFLHYDVLPRTQIIRIAAPK